MTSDDEPILTAREGRAAARLQRTLHETSAELLIHLDAASWVSTASSRRPVMARLPVGLAAVLAVVLLGVLAISVRPAATGPSSPSAAPTSRPGHFDNGTFSFDYPTSWHTLSGAFDFPPIQTDIVIGTGDWKTGCYWTSTGGGCGSDQIDVSGGRVVVKVYRRNDGPMDLCGPRESPNATVGAKAVLKTTDASTTTWEVRLPGGEFGWAGNVFVAAQTENASELARVAALVTSLQWAEGVTAGGCYPAASSSPSPELAHYDSDGTSFDYPASWPVITGYQHWGLHGPTIEFAVGTGTADSGCTPTPPSGGADGGGVTCGGPKIAATGDQVVVVWYQAPTLGMADQLPSGNLPSGETRVTIGGMPAIESHGDGWVRWQVSRVAYIEGRWGPDASDGESQVLALVASLRIATPAQSLQSQ